MATTESAATQVADRLRQQIFLGQLEPGAALRQEALADELGVSRMPVRDALQKLSAEGLVVIHPNRGTFVSTMTEGECAEIFDLREMIEVDALRRAVPMHTDASRRRLRFVQEELEHAEDIRRWVDGDREFHEVLYSPCARARSLEIIQRLRDSVQRFYIAEMHHSDHRQGWKREHRTILRAVDKGDPESACAALRDHIRETGLVVRRRLNDPESARRSRDVDPLR